ncbi:MAG: hypothetical protein HY862_16185 [Chloroflexi bacterium]|nr:hypothetical protein [Chloroflexota bacterium]
MNAAPDRDDLPAPLLGCLFCHTEGAMTLTEPRRFLGIGGRFPLLICNHCGSTASFDYDEVNGAADHWGIRYRHYNHGREYYYAGLYLGKAGWLSADDALEISTRAYVQRHRVRQTQQGNLQWLKPLLLSPPPPLLSPDEKILMTFQHVIFYQGNPNTFAQGGLKALDTGSFFVTDHNIHLLGHKRDWSYALRDIQAVNYNERAWFLYVPSSGTLPEFFFGENRLEELDAQLVTAVLEILRQTS